MSHRDLVALLIEVAGSGHVRCVEWPPDKLRIDICSFYSDSSKFRRVTGWSPTMSLRDGLRRTIDYYRAHYDRYVGHGASV